MNQQQSVIVTGGAGFIGSNFILDWFAQADASGVTRPLVNLDKLTYAGNLENLASLAGRSDYTFVHGDICDAALEPAYVLYCPALLGAVPLRLVDTFSLRGSQVFLYRPR